MKNFLSVGVSVVLFACGVSVAQSSSQPVPAKKIEPAKTDAKEKKPITLKVGDKAPALAVTTWVKGDAVAQFEKNKVYIVEFWATWCGPCIENIPHMTELQKKHKDVVVIGMASSERIAKDGTDNRLENVKKFVTKKGSEMDYRVAYDADRKMSESWMRAAGQGGIPCAFIVGGDGKVAWIGHPSEMEEPLAAAIKAAGTTKTEPTDTKHESKKDKTKDKATGK